MTDPLGRIGIVEVGPRDGLQNEPLHASVADRRALIAALAAAGLAEIEVGSFVSPAWVPQMAGTAEVMAAPVVDVIQHVLIPNLTGWNRFVAARVPDVRYVAAVFVSASEGFSRANLNCGTADALSRAAAVVAAARADGTVVRGYVSCVTDCPFDGPTDPGTVARTVAALREMADMEVSLGDTIGRGTPATVDAMLAAVLQVAPATALAGHFHDTGGQALANVGAALTRGLRRFDTAVGGLGGCPYAPGAPGNLATEALVDRLHTLGYGTGVDAALLARATATARALRAV